MRKPNADERLIMSLSARWPRTGHRSKVECPDCGAAGFAAGIWTWKHVRHTTAVCGKTVPLTSLRAHEARCNACLDTYKKGS